MYVLYVQKYCIYACIICIYVLYVCIYVCIYIYMYLHTHSKYTSQNCFLKESLFLYCIIDFSLAISFKHSYIQVYVYTNHIGLKLDSLKYMFGNVTCTCINTFQIPNFYWGTHRSSTCLEMSHVHASIHSA